MTEADRPGIAADADTGAAGCTDNHVSKFTNPDPAAGGDNTGVGNGNNRATSSNARRAKSSGGNTGTHADCTTSPSQTRAYKTIGAPFGPGGPGAITSSTTRIHGPHDVVPAGRDRPPLVALATHADTCGAGPSVALPPPSQPVEQHGTAGLGGPDGDCAAAMSTCPEAAATPNSHMAAAARLTASVHIR